MNELIKINLYIFILDEKSFTKLLLYGDCRYDSKTNQIITILASAKLIYSSKRWWTINVMKETKYMLALFSFQCLPYYIKKPDNECVNNVLVFFLTFLVL